MRAPNLTQAQRELLRTMRERNARIISCGHTSAFIEHTYQGGGSRNRINIRTFERLKDTGMLREITTAEPDGLPPVMNYLTRERTWVPSEIGERNA